MEPGDQVKSTPEQIQQSMQWKEAKRQQASVRWEWPRLRSTMKGFRHDEGEERLEPMPLPNADGLLVVAFPDGSLVGVVPQSCSDCKFVPIQLAKLDLHTLNL